MRNLIGLITASLFVSACALLPSSAEAQWLTFPEFKFEELLRMAPRTSKAETIYEEEEAWQEETKPEPEKEPQHESEQAHHQEPEEEEAPDDEYKPPPRLQYTAVEVGFFIRNYSFTENSFGQYQSFFYGEEDRFGISVGVGYLRQFLTNSYPFGFGVYYYLAKNVRAGLRIQFEPGSSAMARQNYNPYVEFGLLNRLLVPRLEYRFREYKQADIHDFIAGLDIYLGSHVSLRPAYQLSITEIGGGGGSFTNHAAWIKLIVHVFHMLDMYGRFAFSQHDFEAAAPTPFDAYRALDGSGGFLLNIGPNNSMYFDYTYESRNNGENTQTYTLGTLIRF